MLSRIAQSSKKIVDDIESHREAFGALKAFGTLKEVVAKSGLFH
jgi:hypothetical protein